MGLAGFEYEEEYPPTPRLSTSSASSGSGWTGLRFHLSRLLLGLCWMWCWLGLWEPSAFPIHFWCSSSLMACRMRFSCLLPSSKRVSEVWFLLCAGECKTIAREMAVKMIQWLDIMLPALDLSSPRGGLLVFIPEVGGIQTHDYNAIAVRIIGSMSWHRSSICLNNSSPALGAVSQCLASLGKVT